MNQKKKLKAKTFLEKFFSLRAVCNNISKYLNFFLIIRKKLLFELQSRRGRNHLWTFINGRWDQMKKYILYQHWSSVNTISTLNFSITRLGIEFNFNFKYIMKAVKFSENKFNVYTKDAIETLFSLLNKSSPPEIMKIRLKFSLLNVFLCLKF